MEAPAAAPPASGSVTHDDRFAPRAAADRPDMTAVAAILTVGAGIGYPAVFGLVAAEAGGLPVPGETALITAAITASRGRLEIVAVIALAAVGAIVGDNAGYLIGRHAGRRLLAVSGPLAAHRRKALELAEPFFARHGSKAVFLGRWVAGLRTWASWLAGAGHMRWRTFACWNAAGGVAWAITVGLLAYALGHAAKTVVGVLAALAAVSILLSLAAALVCRAETRADHRPLMRAPTSAGSRRALESTRRDEDKSFRRV